MGEGSHLQLLDSGDPVSIGETETTTEGLEADRREGTISWKIQANWWEIWLL